MKYFAATLLAIIIGTPISWIITPKNVRDTLQCATNRIGQVVIAQREENGKAIKEAMGSVEDRIEEIRTQVQRLNSSQVLVRVEGAPRANDK